MSIDSVKSNLVSCEWLNDNQDLAELVVLDATMKKKPNGEVIPTPNKILPNAQMFDFDTVICDQETALPHMLPSVTDFEQAVRKLGINSDSVIVIYDAMGIFSSPRAWWMFKIMGHQQVKVLDGGLPKWVQLGFETTLEYQNATGHGDFKADFNRMGVYSTDQVLKQINNNQERVIDARSKARFYTKESEPREGLRGGHIPNSTCLPFDRIIDCGSFQPTVHLQDIFDEILENFDGKLIFSCGSGVTACILALAADECGYRDYAVYDGSWSEWGANDTLPIET